jgi:predicted MFS family arabinose efflux permease
MSPESRPLRRNRDFFLLWVGQALSELGSQTTTVAYPLLVLAMTGSPAQAGIVGVAKTLPLLLFAVPAGAFADRVDRKLLLIACDVARAVALATLVAAILSDSLSVGHVALVAFVDGAGFATAYVTERGALRNIVPADQLTEAVARNESRSYVAMLAGPPLGGLLFGVARAVPFVVDAVSYAASTVATMLIRTPLQSAVAAERSSVRSELSDGLTWLWRQPFFRATSLLAAAMNPVYVGLYLLAVVRAEDGGASPAATGTMLAVIGGAGLLGSLATPGLRRRLTTRTAILGTSWMTMPLVMVLLSTDDPLLLGLVIGAIEFFAPLTNAVVQGLRIAVAPDRLQGRVQAAAMLVSQSAAWLGPLAVGVALEQLGDSVTIIVLAGWVALAVTCAAFSHGLSRASADAVERAVAA